MLSVATRETCWSPPPYQAANMPFGSETRGWRRVPEGVSALIDNRKGTSAIGDEPIEQKSYLLVPFPDPASDG